MTVEKIPIHQRVVVMIGDYDITVYVTILGCSDLAHFSQVKSKDPEAQVFKMLEIFETKDFQMELIYV